ncbi:MAG: hypothetical protein KGJ79_17455 [Alphaproteobacteria bacterium]|nr:hypothetical protein [Alphaproteobacteria bacterium]
MTKKQKAADFTIGYCKPPKATQFKKGQSGNSKGRPAKRQTVDALLRQILNEPLTVTVAGREEHITALRGVLLKLRNKALEGDIRAIEKFLDKAERFCPEIVASEVQKTAAQDDTAIFRAAVARANRTTAEASTIAVGAAPGTASKTAPPQHPPCRIRTPAHKPMTTAWRRRLSTKIAKRGQLVRHQRCVRPQRCVAAPIQCARPARTSSLRARPIP